MNWPKEWDTPAEPTLASVLGCEPSKYVGGMLVHELGIRDMGLVTRIYEDQGFLAVEYHDGEKLCVVGGDVHYMAAGEKNGVLTISPGFLGEEFFIRPAPNTTEGMACKTSAQINNTVNNQ